MRSRVAVFPQTRDVNSVMRNRGRSKKLPVASLNSNHGRKALMVMKMLK